jgi:hypothetical protein
MTALIVTALVAGVAFVAGTSSAPPTDRSMTTRTGPGSPTESCDESTSTIAPLRPLIIRAGRSPFPCSPARTPPQTAVPPPSGKGHEWGHNQGRRIDDTRPRHTRARRRITLARLRPHVRHGSRRTARRRRMDRPPRLRIPRDRSVPPLMERLAARRRTPASQAVHPPTRRVEGHRRAGDRPGMARDRLADPGAGSGVAPTRGYGRSGRPARRNAAGQPRDVPVDPACAQGGALRRCCGTGCGRGCGMGCGMGCGTGCGRGCGTGCGRGCGTGCGRGCGMGCGMRHGLRHGLRHGMRHCGMRQGLRHAAAGAAAGAAARDAARAAARDALAPTKEALQVEAHKLVDRMLAVTEAN